MLDWSEKAKTYSEEYKREIVQSYYCSNMSQKAYCEAMGLLPRTLRRWVKKYPKPAQAKKLPACHENSQPSESMAPIWLNLPVPNLVGPIPIMTHSRVPCFGSYKSWIIFR